MNLTRNHTEGLRKCTDAPRIKNDTGTPVKTIRECQNTAVGDLGEEGGCDTLRSVKNACEGIEHDGNQTRDVESKVTSDVANE